MRDIILNDVIDNMVPTVTFIQGIVVRDIVKERFGKYGREFEPGRSQKLNFQCV